jgi:hypothetical protein
MLFEKIKIFNTLGMWTCLLFLNLFIEFFFERILKILILFLWIISPKWLKEILMWMTLLTFLPHFWRLFSNWGLLDYLFYSLKFLFPQKKLLHNYLFTILARLSSALFSILFNFAAARCSSKTIFTSSFS